MISLKNISKTYNKGRNNELKVLQSLNLSIEQGDFIAIAGTSGAGKSTLLHILACIDKLDEGEYWFDGRLISDLKNDEYSKIRNKQIGIVLQDFALIDEYTVLQNVMLPLLFDRKQNMRTKKLKAECILEEVGIKNIANQYVWSLSGGQKQRTAIARAVINDPKLILADEPTGALDVKTSEDIMCLFKSLNQKGHTIIIITHDPIVAKSCSRVLSISDGKLSEINQ